MFATNFVEVLKRCESAEGEGSKATIRTALSSLDQTGRDLMRYAMDVYRVFGIKKFERPADGYASVDPDCSNLFAVLDMLANREVTGDAARNLWTETVLSFTPETAEYIERIMDKDPRGGFSVDTYNKVWTDDPIPTFKVMLADTCQTAEEFEDKVQLPAWGANKFDGQRNIAFVEKGMGGRYFIKHIARTGKPADHLNGLFDDDLIAMRELLGYDFVADGEAFAGTFTETINAKKAGNDTAKAKMRYRLFFVMPWDHWFAQKTDITMQQNLEMLQDLMPQVAARRGDGIERVILEKGRIINSYADMEKFCAESIDDDGDEGLIVKALDGVYEWERSITWCKVKRFFDADLQILAVYAGKKKSRLEKSLGGVVAGGYLEDGTLVLTCVGSGFTDALREEIWNNPEKYVGNPEMTFVCKYQEVTKAKSKTVQSLRFGTFEHFRDDKFVEVTEEDLQENAKLIAKLAAR